MTVYGKKGVRSGKKGVRSFVMFDTRTVDYDRQICFWVEYKIGISWTTVNLGNKCLQNKKCQLRGKEVHVSRGTQVYKIDLQTITL